MTEQSAPFAPDWVSPPGDSISDLIEERSWTQSELAQRLGYTEKHLSQLINGKVPLTLEASVRLERVLGGSVDFWLALEANYQKHKARLESARQNAGWVDWLDSLPLKELMSCSAIEKQRIDAKNKPGLVESCLRFFGVASPEEWQAHYGGMEMSFRRSREDQSDVGAISAWLRLGEKQAEQFDGPKYDREKFQKALTEIRALTTEPPRVFQPIMDKLFTEAGVVFVLVPAIPRSHVSGVARWISPHRPLIQMSLYGKTNDKFWFTLFHESAHILLHANEKKSVFLDDPGKHSSTDPREIEANKWAGDFAIPEKYQHHLPTLKTKEAVRAFARKVAIHPGIVVGRLQHDALIEVSWMNDLKVSFKFSTDA
jgi:HTH-type transcriptional regulator/antitoxin HigA